MQFWRPHASACFVVLFFSASTVVVDSHINVTSVTVPIGLVWHKMSGLFFDPSLYEKHVGSLVVVMPRLLVALMMASRTMSCLYV